MVDMLELQRSKKLKSDKHRLKGPISLTCGCRCAKHTHPRDSKPGKVGGLIPSQRAEGGPLN